MRKNRKHLDSLHKAASIVAGLVYRREKLLQRKCEILEKIISLRNEMDHHECYEIYSEHKELLGKIEVCKAELEVINKELSEQDKLSANKNRRTKKLSDNLELRFHKDGTLDECVLKEHFHLEQMDKDYWWIGVSDGETYVHIRLQSKSPIIVGYEE